MSMNKRETETKAPLYGVARTANDEYSTNYIYMHI